MGGKVQRLLKTNKLTTSNLDVFLGLGDESPISPPETVVINESDVSVITQDSGNLSDAWTGGSTQQAEDTSETVPTVIIGGGSSHTQWLQAHCLSTPPFPEADVSNEKMGAADKTLDKPQTLRSITNDANERRQDDCSTTPIVVVLMDPSTRKYEMLFLHIETSTELVKDILIAVGGAVCTAQQQRLKERKCKNGCEVDSTVSIHDKSQSDNGVPIPDEAEISSCTTDATKWMRAYDGLIQFRHSACQIMINCLGLTNYDICPYEIFIAKPLGTSAKRSARHAEHLLQYFLRGGMAQRTNHETVAQQISSDEGSSQKLVKSGDSVVILSSAARSRAYVPGAKAHDAGHTKLGAGHFLTFSPPFEKHPRFQKEPRAHLRAKNDESDDDVSRRLKYLYEIELRCAFSYLSTLPPPPPPPCGSSSSSQEDSYFLESSFPGSVENSCSENFLCDEGTAFVASPLLGPSRHEKSDEPCQLGGFDAILQESVTKARRSLSLKKQSPRLTHDKVSSAGHEILGRTKHAPEKVLKQLKSIRSNALLNKRGMTFSKGTSKMKMSWNDGQQGYENFDAVTKVFSPKGKRLQKLNRIGRYEKVCARESVYIKEGSTTMQWESPQCQLLKRSEEECSDTSLESLSPMVTSVVRSESEAFTPSQILNDLKKASTPLQVLEDLKEPFKIE